MVPSVSEGSAHHKEDVAFIRRVAARDEQALAELYRRYSGVIYSFAVKMLHDTPEAEEVLQDTFLKAWKLADKYQPERGTVFTWLVTMSRSQCLDRLRARKNNPFRSNQHTTLDSMSPQSQPDSSETSIFKTNLGSEIADKLKELPEDQRLCLELSFYKGYTQHEIANRLKEPLGTIKARIRRGLLQLRALLPPL
ncbi:MAG: sigma-70 family RNA polymerase sigma factor [Verrucomicrobiota bacterium]|nr:sigma-70 family RNA polymerase sigma factor [Verrucomicrobiota bacterium]